MQESVTDLADMDSAREGSLLGIIALKLDGRSGG